MDKLSIQTEDTHKVQPWMKPHEVELRTNARQYLDTAIELGILPDTRIKKVIAFAEGESSAVFMVFTESSPYVVKMRAEEGGVETEAAFLNAWNNEGVKVPQVLKVLPATKDLPTSVMSMEFIDAPLLGDAFTSEQLVKKGIARELGITLTRMHRVKGEGFGFPIVEDTTKGTFPTFREEAEKSFMGQRVKWMLQQGVIREKDIEAMQIAISIIEEDIQKGTKPSLTHNDFRPYNMFATEPITIFDPDPRITHPVICLSFALLKPLIDKNPNPKVREEMLSGYREVTSIGDRVLAAATVLRGIRKVHSWLRKGRESEAKFALNVVRDSERLLV